MLCRTFKTIEGDDIECFKYFIMAMFYLIPTQNYDYTRFAVMYLHSNNIDSVKLLGKNNSELVNWSIDFRNFMNRRFNTPTVHKTDIQQQFALSKLTKGVWGPVLWKTIHLFSVVADLTNNYIKFKVFITCLQFVIPCVQCRKNFKTHMINPPLDDSIKKKDVFQWGIDIHNKTTKLIVDQINVQNVKNGIPVKLFKPYTRKIANQVYFDPLHCIL